MSEMVIPPEFDENEYDPNSQMEMVTETCVAHFLGGPLDGVRDPGFIWDENYRNGHAYYAWPVWVQEDQDDPESVRLLGSHQYKITVNSHEPGKRLITCTNEGFSDEGC